MGTAWAVPYTPRVPALKHKVALESVGSADEAHPGTRGENPHAGVQVVYWSLLVPGEAELEAHGRFPGMPQWTQADWLNDGLAGCAHG